MAVTIFYSWQSDSASKTNHRFIKEALEVAVNRLVADGHVEEAPRVDHDTQGVHGDPDIFPTILRKIDECDVFIADVTIVATTAEGKNVPNPNVLLELGYAYNAAGTGRIIKIMNDSYGNPKEGLPFDLAHKRWPYTYTLPEDADKQTREKVKESVAKDLADFIRMILVNEGPKGVAGLGRKSRFEEKIAYPLPAPEGVPPVQYLIEAQIPSEKSVALQDLMDAIKNSKIFCNAVEFPLTNTNEKDLNGNITLRRDSQNPYSNETRQVLLIKSNNVTLTHWVRDFRIGQQSKFIEATEFIDEGCRLLAFYRRVAIQLGIFKLKIRIKLFGIQGGSLHINSQLLSPALQNFVAPETGEIEIEQEIELNILKEAAKEFAQLLKHVWQEFRTPNGHFPRLEEEKIVEYIMSL